MKISHLNITVLSIFFVAAFLLLYRLDFSDSVTDGSHYSLRAVTYVDYILPYNQTTPIEWFGAIPWWSKLSFHDAPPLVFIIQHIFFTLFGENLWVMRLPFVLAALGTLAVLYVLMKRYFGKPAAYIASALLSVSTFFTWSGRTSYLEGMVVFFSLLAIYLFLRALDDEKYFLWFGIVLGLALLTKYTAFFLIIFLAFYVLFFRRDLWRHKKFVYALVVALCVFLPVVLYNFMVLKTRGHFDVQFSHLFSSLVFDAAQRDWPVLFYETPVKKNFAENFSSIWSLLRTGFSPPLFAVYVLSLMVLCVLAFLKRDKKRYGLFLCIILSIVVVIVTISPVLRYMPIFTPFLAGAGGLVVSEFFFFLRKRQNLFVTGIAVFFAIIALETVFNIRTHHVAQAEESAFWQTPIAEKNLGFRQLEEYLSGSWKTTPHYRELPRRIVSFNDLLFDWEKVAGNNVYLYDSDINWFARTWHLNRYLYYHDVLILTEAEVAGQIGTEKNLFEAFQKLGAKNLFYVKGKNDSVYTPGYQENPTRAYAEFLEERFIEYLGGGFPGETHDIYDAQDRHAFRVYRIELH